MYPITPSDRIDTMCDVPWFVITARRTARDDVHHQHGRVRLNAHHYERIARDYPRSRLAPAALFRIAVNAENSLEFDKAIASYQKLAREYPQSADREAALLYTIRLLEGLRVGPPLWLRRS